VQVEALVALYNQTNGDSWTANTNWLAGDPCANNWFGVICGSNSNVQRLSLYSNNLVGSIPPELGDLDFLDTLYLDDNQLAKLSCRSSWGRLDVGQGKPRPGEPQSASADSRSRSSFIRPSVI
jgi:Leucine-rich repeat (LRR) protein